MPRLNRSRRALLTSSHAAPAEDQAKGPLYLRVAKILQARILHGDYSLKAIPSERKLAQEFGINFMTVRRSLRSLEKSGLLSRQPNGRLAVKGPDRGSKQHFNFAILLPTHVSGVFSMLEECRRVLQRVSQDFPCSIRPVLYSHWNDPALLDSIKAFDGIFLYPFTDPPPAAVEEKLRSAGHPVIVLDHDFTRYGIPSIHFFPPVFVQKLLDHLAQQGHRSIGCLNTQGHNIESLARINQWRLWTAAHNFDGRLVDRPIELYGYTAQRDSSVAVATHSDFQVERYGSGAHVAYTVMKQVLKDAPESETAWLCVTMPAAIGTMRAMSDLGIRPGEDIAICAVNGEGLAELMVPSVTALEQPDMETFLKFSLKWMLSGKTAWQGPLLMQPGDAPVVVRDSTRKIFGPVRG